MSLALHDLVDRADALGRIDALLDAVVDRLGQVRSPRDLPPLYDLLTEIGVLFRAIDGEPPGHDCGPRLVDH